MSLTPFLAWREERNRALRALDIGYARRLMPTATGDDVRLMAMHKARYECTDLEPELRHASADWLRERGFSRMSGDPILPEGQLPI